MSKAVLISIKPHYCELIANGKKTVEVRKTRPKIEIPFKCYIYCSLNGSVEFFKNMAQELGDYEAVCKWNREKWGLKKGKVIGEFVCNSIDAVYPFERAKGVFLNTFTDTCLSADEYMEYSCGKTTFFWHISDLVIYDKPKELIEFQKCPRKLPYDPVLRPPQSLCYVEELGAV